MKPMIPRATAEQIEQYIQGHQDLKEVISQRTLKQQERLRTKHPGRSARNYMTLVQTQEYLANLRAQEKLSEQTRHQHMAKSSNPFQELRRAFNDHLQS